jgi:excisionase family DNA binding protein
MPAIRQEVIDEPDLRAVGVDEAADLLAVSRWTLYELLRDETIPSFRLAGRRLIRVHQLRAFVEAAEAEGYDTFEAEG